MAIFGTLGENNLGALSASITDTAVDVFVYDTTKDSDGGAWRKRTQNTSWYNETLGTATRGTRREFPAVAVIVMQEGTLTIYDGDDPDLPMWMVFTDNNDTGSQFASAKMLSCRTATSIFMLNGMLMCVGKGPYHDGATELNFLSDSAKKHMNNGYYYNTLNISQRETTGGYFTVTSGTPSIVSNLINDLVMTVLPNAPIGDTTGLPVPTIAVATDGGVSVIKDDGNVINATGSGIYAFSKAITITEENYLWWLGDNYLTNDVLRDSWAVSLDNFPSSNFTWNSSTDNMSGGSYYAVTTNGEQGEIKIGSGNTWAWNHQERNALGGPAGLAIHKPNIGSENNSLIAAITSDYNTGWMHGDIKGAFLSDTSTTNISSTNLNLITNGDFSNGTTGWSNDATPTFTVSGGGVASVGRNGGGATGQCYQTITTEVGRTYTVGVLLSAVSDGFQVYAGESPSSANITMSQGAVNTTGTHYFTFTASTTTTRLDFSATQNTSGTASFDNITIFDGVADRSINAKGLSVYGTVTKSAVATGAELVGYSGFSSSNKLVQPYTSDLDFGTDSFSVTWWHKVTGNLSDTSYAFDRQGSNGNRFAVYLSAPNSGSVNFYAHSGSGKEVVVSGINGYANTWMCITVARTSSGFMQIYINGEQGVSTDKGIFSLTNTSAELFIGIRHDGSASPADQDDMALMRFSASIPSDEQIRKIYEDEKCLFHENAKATLYGSSDAVTALAFDDTTNLLHVGTSAGRSEFQGLSRINNTTDAVTTAISAHDSLIIEQ